MTAEPSRLLVLSEANVSKVLQSLTTNEIISIVGKAFYTYSQTSRQETGENEDKEQDLSRKKQKPNLQENDTPIIQNPLRITTSTPNHNLLYMPSRLGSEKTTSIKVVSVPRDPRDKTGLPATTVVFDEKTGQAKAVLNARALTAVRTAAASALALSTAKLASQARVLLIFGSGLQADWHARLVSTLSSKLETIIIASREVNTRSEELKHDLSEYFKPKGIEVKACSIAEAAEWGGPAHSADLICCCTPSTVPLFDSSELQAGAGVALIGSYKPHMHELDFKPLLQADRLKRVIVDNASACIAEAGEIQKMLRDTQAESEGQKREGRDLLKELGELVDETGQTNDAEPGDVTIFKCVGMGIMDAAISALVVTKAEEMGECSKLPF